MNKWLNELVGSTAVRYLITMAASWLAAKLGADQGQVAGVLTQVVAVGVAITGVVESSKDKIVVDGQRVVIPADVKPKAKTLVDMIKGQ